MYYDIFFSNPQAEYEAGADGVVVTFPGNESCVVYAVSDRGSKRLHCLVTEEQLAQLDDDNINYKFYDKSDNAFKKDEGWPLHVFNPSGVVYKKNGNKKIHRIGAPEEEDLDPIE